MTNESRDANRLLRRLFFSFGVLMLMLLVALMQYWYLYVTKTEDLYDTYGVKITKFLPRPLQSWGCSQLKSRFFSFSPPQPCTSRSGLEWR